MNVRAGKFFLVCFLVAGFAACSNSSDSARPSENLTPKKVSYDHSAVFVITPTSTSFYSEAVPSPTDPTKIPATSKPVLVLDCGPSVVTDAPTHRILFGQTSTRGSGSIESYAVEFGDGQRASGTDPQIVFNHEYTAPGAYDVSAVASASDGLDAYASCRFDWSRPLPPAPAVSQAVPSSPEPCANGSFLDSNGASACRPYPTNTDTPAGATAICKDGSISFSLHRSGTCSGHGGVQIWL